MKNPKPPKMTRHQVVAMGLVLDRLANILLGHPEIAEETAAIMGWLAGECKMWREHLYREQLNMGRKAPKLPK